MNAELPPFKSGEHNSDSASTIDRVITPLKTEGFGRIGGVLSQYLACLRTKKMCDLFRKSEATREATIE